MKYRSKLLITTLCLHAVAVCAARSTPPPKLVIQIVVSQMRYDYLKHFSANFSTSGFNRFINDGVSFEECRYDYMLTNTEASLATLTTGSMPSTHGVVGRRWIDFVTGGKVDLAEDKRVYGLECDAGLGCYSASQLTVPTLGDRLLEDSPRSKVVTMASSPSSAIVMGGMTRDVYWSDISRGRWISSSHYMARLPEWIVKYNDTQPASQYLDMEWTALKQADKYVNKRYSLPGFASATQGQKLMGMLFDQKEQKTGKNYPKIYDTYAGNNLVCEFARRAIIHYELGRDEDTDLLNICFDSPRLVSEIYGSESKEIEDLYYRLDEDLAELVSFVYSQVDPAGVIILLTSDHGASDSFDRDKSNIRDRFNISQFKVIVNGFMNAQYGDGDWVTDYSDRQLYLNRELIYRKGLSLAEVQNRVGAFALHFRGVSHSITATALNNSSFASGHGRMMQNSFYPRHSGDVIINLLPGWIEERDGVRSLSGSMYDYDTHVPLMFLGGTYGQSSIRSPVEMTMVAPTLARIMQIGRPQASTGAVIEVLTQ